jgi:hypothetical protein
MIPRVQQMASAVRLAATDKPESGCGHEEMAAGESVRCGARGGVVGRGLVGPGLVDPGLHDRMLPAGYRTRTKRERE